MAWSTPVTHVTGYTVIADDWNELVNDLKYLKGTDVGADGGVIIGNNGWYQGKFIVGGTLGPGSYVSVDSFVLAGVHVPGNVVSIYGLNNQYSLSAAANCGTFYGYYGAHTIATGGGNALTTYVGAFFGSPTVSSGSITTAYGAYIAPQTSASSNNYGLWIGVPSGGGGSNIGLYVAGGDTGVYVLAGGLWVAAGGMVVEAGGIDVTGASTITGTLGGITTLTATTLAGTLSTAAQPNVTSVGTLTGLTMGGAINCANNIISNIGAAGTDFTATGGLTLADTLTVAGGGMSVTQGTGATLTLIKSGAAGETTSVYQGVAASGEYNWKIGKGVTIANAFEWIPSTAVDGSTYSTAVMTLSSAGALTTAAGITVQTGIVTIGTSTTSQLIIDQSTADGEILTLRSSTDVAHPMTGITTTATYGYIAKAEATSGGLLIRGLKDADGGNYWGVFLEGMLGEAADTTKSTLGRGVVEIRASVTDGGTSVTAVGADGNLLSISNGGTTRFLFDAEGSGHQDVGTAWTEFDAHDDIALLSSLSHQLARPGNAIGQEFGRWLSYNRRDLEALKLVSFNDGPGGDRRPFVNMSKLTMLHGGAIRQAFARIEDVWATLEERTEQLTAVLSRLGAVEQRLALLGGAA